MKVGDYVRTEKGIIGKFNVVKTGETIPNWNGGYGYKEIDKEYIDNNVYNRFDDKIIKSSQNILDLIEIGDYVNGTMVTEIKDGKPFKEDYNDPYYSYYFDDIYSIVTKEQFSQMEYRIGE